MSRNRDRDFGGPREETEVVVTVDQRLILGGGLVLVFMLALGGGVWWARRSATAALPGAAAGGANAAAQATAQVQRQMAELGMPTSAVVLNPDAIVESTSLPPAGALAPVAGGTPAPTSDGPGRIQFNVTITPASTEEADLLKKGQEMGGQPFTVPENRPKTDSWTHDVLAGMEDPNYTKKEYEPARTEEVKQPLEGPRLGISELNVVNTFDYGKIPMDVPSTHDFTMTNVGDADLTVGRIYAGCGCTATKFGDVYLDEAGFLPAPVTLKPGESRVFGIEYDPRDENRAQVTSKSIQIFSNDLTKAQFTPSDPNSRETRFRIVVQTTYEVKAPAGAKTYKVLKFGGNEAEE